MGSKSETACGQLGPERKIRYVNSLGITPQALYEVDVRA